MAKKQRFLITITVLFLVSLFFFMLYSEQGLFDLNLLKKQRDLLVEKNKRLSQKNLSLSVEIDRLENDPKYIENIARQELGMIAKDELILKPRTPSNP